MRFWDSSAIIPLCLKEQMSETIRRLIKADEDIVVWWATKIECLSALARRRREGVIGPDADIKARAILSALAAEWSELQPSELIRQRAERLLTIHPLRSADSFQLAAALLWAQESPQGFQFVCLDQNLREAAQKEGFTVIP
ncbi:MAG: type II toxin-antitoxin system VapC family toxin [Deltaproteobacteria bacterium]|nr:type II toxin-antitoxin system VapC family toxin [Deltaproteobacteria bacterium]